MTQTEALKLALEALERGETELRWKAITTIKEALAQPEQEPVAWRYGALLYWDKLDALEFMRTSNDGYQLEPLYTTPPQSIWVGLTDEERQQAMNTVTYSQLAMTSAEWAYEVQKATEAKLKEKNT